MDTQKLQEILKSHAVWVNGNGGGSRANLSDAYLRGADLSDADLRDADLRGADLSDADLSDADLSDADLRGADLSDADLSDADLSYADLSYANLRDADLRGADLSYADLDFSEWPLWCGSASVKIDERIARQLLAHAFSVAREFCPPTIEQVEFCNQFHRIVSGEFPKL